MNAVPMVLPNMCRADLNGDSAELFGATGFVQMLELTGDFRYATSVLVFA